MSKDDENQIRFAAAALAMQAVAAKFGPDPGYAKAIAELAVTYADALLFELQKPRPTV